MMFADTGLVQELLRRFANAQLRANRIQLLSKRRYSAFRAGSVAFSARLLAFAARSRHFFKLSSIFFRRMIVHPPLRREMLLSQRQRSSGRCFVPGSVVLRSRLLLPAFDDGRQGRSGPTA